VNIAGKEKGVHGCLHCCVKVVRVGNFVRKVLHVDETVFL
jgi:hypothetical protein